VKALVFFGLNVLCLLPVLFSLDPWTPPVFLALAVVILLAVRPDRWAALAGVLVLSLVLAWWVFVTNLLWTVGGHAETRALLLGIRVWGLTGISAAFALGVRTSDLLNEAMQLLGLPPRIGFALFTALNTLPRLREEQRHLQAVHRVRLGGRSSSPFVQALTLLAGAIRSAERSALSLAARGLESSLPRTWYRPAAWTLGDGLQGLAGALAAVGLLVWLLVSGLFAFGFY